MSYARHILFLNLIYSLAASPALGFAEPNAYSHGTQLKTDLGNIKPQNQIQIVADFTDIDRINNHLIAHSDVQVAVNDQDAYLKAEHIEVDLIAESIEAEGNVFIIRRGIVTTSTDHIKFKIDSNKYLITTPSSGCIEPRLITRVRNTAPLVVSDVAVAGNRLIPSSRILDAVKTKRGDPFVRDNVVSDLVAIGQLGFFDLQSIQCTPVLNGRNVLLKIQLRENMPVSGFEVDGNKVISKRKIVFQSFFLNQLGKPAN